MIDQKNFQRSYQTLALVFNKELPNVLLAASYEYLSAWLNDREFNEAIDQALAEAKFMPSAKELVESVLGTLGERAIIEWYGSDRSAIGRRAYESIGGASAVKNSDRPGELEKQFISHFVAFAKGAKPEELARLPLKRIEATESRDRADVQNSDRIPDTDSRRAKYFQVWIEWSLSRRDPKMRLRALRRAEENGFTEEMFGKTDPKNPDRFVLPELQD